MSLPNDADSVAPGSARSSLLTRARARDAAAWHQLVDLYGPLVCAWCRQARLPAEDVADVVQEVFRAVAQSLSTFHKSRPGDTFRGWLRVITRNKVRDHFRKERGQPRAAGGSSAQRHLTELPDLLSDGDEPCSPGADGGLLHRALELVRAEFEVLTWQAFWRTAVDGQAPVDVAAALGLTVNAVYKARSRVLRRLREELGELLP